MGKMKKHKKKTCVSSWKRYSLVCRKRHTRRFPLPKPVGGCGTAAETGGVEFFNLQAGEERVAPHVPKSASERIACRSWSKEGRDRGCCSGGERCQCESHGAFLLTPNLPLPSGGGRFSPQTIRAYLPCTLTLK